MSMKKSNYNIGNRTRELPVCTAVPQALRHRVPLIILLLYQILLRVHCNVFTILLIYILLSHYFWHNKTCILIVESHATVLPFCVIVVLSDYCRNYCRNMWKWRSEIALLYVVLIGTSINKYWLNKYNGMMLPKFVSMIIYLCSNISHITQYRYIVSRSFSHSPSIWSS
jgi:hypothetical protein